MPVSRNRKLKKKNRKGQRPPKTKLTAVVEKEEEEHPYGRQLIEKLFGKSAIEQEPERFRHLLIQQKKDIKIYTNDLSLHNKLQPLRNAHGELRPGTER